MDNNLHAGINCHISTDNKAIMIRSKASHVPTSSSPQTVTSDILPPLLSASALPEMMQRDRTLAKGLPMLENAFDFVEAVYTHAFLDQIGRPFDIVAARRAGDLPIVCDLEIERFENALLLALGHVDAAGAVEAAAIADLAERRPDVVRSTPEVGDAIASRVGG